MVRAILFDAVGTLIDPDPPAAEAYWKVGRALGSSKSLAEIEELFRPAYRRSESLFALPGGGDSSFARLPTSDQRERQRWRQVVGEVFGDLDPSTAEQALDCLWRHFARADSWRLYGDVASTWLELSNRGYLLGIASNFDRRLPGICEALPPLDDCRRIFVSSQVGYPKPAPQFFQAVECALGLKPEEILLVGDDETNDVEGATRCGWQAQLLVREGPLTAGAIRSLSDLPAMLSE